MYVFIRYSSKKFVTEKFAELPVDPNADKPSAARYITSMYYKKAGQTTDLPMSGFSIRSTDFARAEKALAIIQSVVNEPAIEVIYEPQIKLYPTHFTDDPDEIVRVYYAPETDGSEDDPDLDFDYAEPQLTVTDGEPDCYEVVDYRSGRALYTTFTNLRDAFIFASFKTKEKPNSPFFAPTRISLIKGYKETTLYWLNPDGSEGVRENVFPEFTALIRKFIAERDKHVVQPEPPEVADTVAAVAETLLDVNANAPEGWEVFYDCNDNLFTVTFDEKPVANLDDLSLLKILPPDEFFSQFQLAAEEFSADKRNIKVDALKEMRRQLSVDTERVNIIDKLIADTERDKP